MEADWSVEVGPGLPCIECKWDGFVDLRNFPSMTERLEEAVQHPALRVALLGLNSASSSLFTTKCDAWKLDEDAIDPSEFAAFKEAAYAGFASYIDVVKPDPAALGSFALHEKLARDVTADCRSLDLRQGRIDVVLRSAITDYEPAYGLTLYAAGCGANPESAYKAWQAILAAAVAATIAAARTPGAGE